jgi:hypothetical protein
MTIDSETQNAELSPRDAGLILGVLIGEGYFGGDGHQPHVAVKMHVRHEPLLRWLLQKIPGSKLYGPYKHTDRHYYQWMVRGSALKSVLVPLLDSLPFADIDPHSYERYQQMKEKYGLNEQLSRETEVPAGVIIGLLLKEGHFGGDGKQPHVTLRRHVRHESLFHWLLEKIPGSRLYGPYSHGGRQYYQWMARGEVLKTSLIPLIDSFPLGLFDAQVQERYQQMKERYEL